MDYNKMVDRKTVENNYADSGNLATRISLHAKYSTNPYGWSKWVWDRYRLVPGCRILELGCGNAGFWEGRACRLPAGASLVLTDLSAGMVAEAARRFSGDDRIQARQADITDIPFADGSFDIVIANHMLYHVDGLDKAIREVYRVLVPGGAFYSTTNGENGIMGYLDATAAEITGRPAGQRRMNFSLQNGREILARCFPEVTRMDYEDSLLIPEIDDWLDYLFSALSMTGLEDADRSVWHAYYNGKKDSNGLLHVPKETGMFISTK